MDRSRYNIPLYIKIPLALAITSIALSGCFGGSSSSSSNDNDDTVTGDDSGSVDDTISSSLTDEQQTLVATQMLATFGVQADSFSDEGAEQSPDAAASSNGSMGTASTQSFECDSGGPMLYDEDASFSGDSIPFPDGINGNPTTSGSGFAISADDCRMNEGGQSIRIDGQTEEARFGDFDGGNGTIYLRFGGFSGDTFADISNPFISGEETNLQGHMALCYSCVDADPGNLSGQPEDSAFVAHFRSDVDGFRLRLGENVPNGVPLSVITEENSSGALLNANGRHAFEDQDCAIDVTMETQTPIQVDSWGPTVISPNIESGEMNIRTNASGETFSIEWINGTQYINGEEVSDSLLDEVAACT